MYGFIFFLLISIADSHIIRHEPHYKIIHNKPYKSIYKLSGYSKFFKLKCYDYEYIFNNEAICCDYRSIEINTLTININSTNSDFNRLNHQLVNSLRNVPKVWTTFNYTTINNQEHIIFKFSNNNMFTADIDNIKNELQYINHLIDYNLITKHYNCKLTDYKKKQNENDNKVVISLLCALFIFCCLSSLCKK